MLRKRGGINIKMKFRCKVGYHNWSYLPEYHGFKEGGDFLKQAIFLGHVKQIRQCKECLKLQAKHSYSGVSMGSSIIETACSWEDYNFVMEYINKNYVQGNRMRAW